MQDIFVLSGLGVDERVFKNIHFGNLNPLFIKWIKPLEDESIESYAKRLSTQITSDNPIILGLSFGGMMAIEIGKQIKTKKIILIASAKNKNEIPSYYRLAGNLKLSSFLPSKLLKQNNFITSWFFGVKQESEKKLLTTILEETDTDILKWSIDKIVNWKNEDILDNVIHIHGDKDKILPIRYVKYDFKAKNGGHFMTISNAEELSGILKKIFD